MHLELSKKLQTQGLSLIVHITVCLQQGNKIDAKEIDNFIDSMIKEIKSMIAENKNGTIAHLTVADEEHYPMVHAINVAFYSLIFAIELGYEGYDLREIGTGALLHDLGKINTPDELYWKQIGTTDYEKITISEHPMFGSHILSSGALISDTVKRIIHEHHENHDGSGYPLGLSDADQLQQVKIVSLCNYLDYLLTSYPGTEVFTLQHAILDITKKSGSWFQPRLVNQFLKIMSDHICSEPLFPYGTLVLLSTGEIAAVTKTTSLTDFKPDLQLITDEKRRRLIRPLKIELKKDSSRSITQILQKTKSVAV